MQFYSTALQRITFQFSNDLFDIYTLFGIAWVMALFEGTVAYVMISASMKSMA